MNAALPLLGFGALGWALAGCAGVGKPGLAGDSVVFTDSTVATDSGDTGLQPADTAPPTLVPVADPTCAWVREPQLGLVVDCRSQWSDADATALVDGTLTYNILDVTGTSLTYGQMPIVTIIPGSGAFALIDGGVVEFFLSVPDSSQPYDVWQYVTTADGLGSSAEVDAHVDPYSP